MMWRVTPPDFAPAWARLVTAWLTLGEDGLEGEALLQRALDHGLHALDLPAASEISVGQGRRCEVAVVRLAGAVDEAGYLAHNQAQAERGAEPVDHFCRRGWRGLRNPSLDFDVWWYWAEYLDPTDESETAINPLVHYLLDGRHRGLLPLPQRAARAVVLGAGAAPPGLPVRDVRPGRTGRRLRRGVRRRAGPARRRVRAGRRVAGARAARPAVRRDRRMGARARRTRLRLMEPAGQGAGRVGRARGVRRGPARERLVLAGAAARRSVRGDGRQTGRLLGAAAHRTAVRAGALPAAVGAARGGEAVVAAADRVPLPRAGARRLLLPGPAPSGARRPRLPAPPRRRPAAAGPGQPGAEVRDRHHAVPRRPGLRLLDLGARPAAQPPDLRTGRLRPARRGLPAVQAPLPGREPVRHPGPGRLEAAHPGRRPRRACRRCSSATCSASPTPTSSRGRSRSGRRDSPACYPGVRSARASWATSTRRAARAAKECSVRTRSAAARRVASSPKTESGSARVASRARSSGVS